METDLLKPLLAQAVRSGAQLLAEHGAKVADEALAVADRVGQKVAEYLTRGGRLDPATGLVHCEMCGAGPIPAGDEEDQPWVCQMCAAVLGWDGVTGRVTFQARVFGTPYIPPSEVEQLTDKHHGWVWRDNDDDELRGTAEGWQMRSKESGSWSRWVGLGVFQNPASLLTSNGPYTRVRPIDRSER